MIRILTVYFILFWSGVIRAQSFQCTDDLYMAVSPESVVTKFYRLSLSDGADSVTFRPFDGFADVYINAIGYRRTDNLIYGINPNSHALYAIQASGKATFITALQGINPNHHYIAGDVSPDGSQLVIQGGNITDSRIFDTELVFIDLSPPYNTRVVPIETESGFGVKCADIAFHPLTRVLYGFDGISGRLVIIDPSTADIDDLTFEAHGSPDVMASLFFNASGTLFGYGQPPLGPGQSSNDRLQGNAPKINTLYKIDVNTGDVVLIARGPEADGNDGCSCPYNLDVHKIARPSVVTSCSEITYTFVVFNATSKVQTGISFIDVLPIGMKIINIENNPFGGIVLLSDQLIEIQEMEIPPGIDSIVISVNVDELSPGIYKNQSRLFNLSGELGSVIYSDDPTTNQINDSTALTVTVPGNEIGNTIVSICKGDTARLASIADGKAEYLWNNGSIEEEIEITQEGKYWVEVESRCEVFTDTFVVIHDGKDIIVDLGQDIHIFLGEEVQLRPQVNGGYDLLYQWNEDPGRTLNCYNCLNAIASPRETSTFQFSASDKMGCKSIDDLTVFVDQTARVYFPNIFSPNGDSINDNYKIDVASGTKINWFKIYSRNGILIHDEDHTQLKEHTHGWDGTFNGAPLNPQVFAFVAEIEFFNGRIKIYHGDITLIR